MGYSNNKWRKILTILMIINLCFILFTKFSTVFGSFSVNVPNTENTLELPDFFNDYNFIVYFRYIFNKYNLKICLSSKSNKYYANSNTASIFVENADTIKYLTSTGFNDFNSMKNYINSITISFFTDLNVTAQGNTNIDYNSALLENGTDTYIINSNIYNGYTGIANNDILINNNTTISPFFTNNTEIEQGNPDGVFIQPGDFSNTDTIYFHLLEITNGLANGDTSLYYYNDKIFALDKDSDYYRTWIDPEIEGFYYYIPRYKLGLSQNTSYLYVLNNSKSQIQNSNGVIEKDVANGIYDVVESDTTGVISATEEENDRMKDIQSTITENNERIDNIDDSLSNTTVNQDTETDIDSSLSFNNSTPQFSNLFNNYFSRLTSLVAELGNYEDNNIITINLPVPHSNTTIPIRSDILSSHIPADIYFIIQMVWFFIFGRYYLKFLLKVYHLVSTGLLLDYYSLSGEVITQDML